MGVEAFPASAAQADSQPGLRKNAIKFVSNVVIGVASVAPGYSLAATLGLIVGVAGIGVQAPAVMIVAFIPMLCIAAAYYWMNRAVADCGTTYSWVTRAMGPHLGWLGGWGIIAADILVMPSLAYVAGNYSYLLFGWDSAADNQWAVLAVGVAWIILMTWICYIGVELSARTQKVLLSIEVFTLALFAIVALVKVYSDHPPGSIEPALSWFNPFEISSLTALTGGILLAIFIYWGWDSAVAVNEETEDSTRAPGKAAIVSTLILLGIYLLVTTAAQAFAGTKTLIDNPDDVFVPIGDAVLGGTLDKVLIIAVLTSAAASTQTTILPTARTSFSMARDRAIPRRFSHVHPTHLSPDFSTIVMGAASAALLIVLTVWDVNLIFDAFTALGLMIAFYYGITGYACVIYYRRELFRSWKNTLFMGVLPLIGALMLTWVLVKSFIDIRAEDSGYAPAAFGVGAPFIIAVAVLVLGAILWVWAMARYRDFFKRKPSIVTAEELAGVPATEPI